MKISINHNGYVYLFLVEWNKASFSVSAHLYTLLQYWIFVQYRAETRYVTLLPKYFSSLYLLCIQNDRMFRSYICYPGKSTVPLIIFNDAPYIQHIQCISSTLVIHFNISWGSSLRIPSVLHVFLLVENDSTFSLNSFNGTQRTLWWTTMLWM